MDPIEQKAAQIGTLFGVPQRRFAIFLSAEISDEDWAMGERTVGHGSAVRPKAGAVLSVHEQAQVVLFQCLDLLSNI